jgi:hypothetical protein
LFDYENIDYWIVDPQAGNFRRPRKFGYRTPEDTKHEENDTEEENE